MIAKKRVGLALILSLFWTVTVVASFHIISEINDQDQLWIIVYTSLPMMIVGLIFFFGEIRLLLPYLFLSKEELSKYNVEKISFALGITMIALSYPFIFIHIYGSAFVWVAICVALILIEFMAIYTSAAKRFKTDT